MKKAILILVFVVLLSVWLRSRGQFVPAPPTSSPHPMPTGAPPPTILSYQGKDYALYLQNITGTRVLLIPNFTAKKSSAELITEHHCRVAVNGGYYTRDNQPLGLFYTDEQYYNRKIHTKTLTNGFVYQTKAGKFTIAADPPAETLNFIFQTGPLFTPDTKLTIQADEMARRVLLGQTQDDQQYVLALTEADNSNSGPQLADVPPLLREQQLQFAQLINLDGGSASTYYAPPSSLSEITPIGSLLCFL